MPITSASFRGRGEEVRGLPSFGPLDVRAANDGDADDERKAGEVTIKGKRGQKPIDFQEGGLHASTGTPAGEKIPAAKMAAAKAGKLGPKARKQANFAANVLKGK